MRECGAGRLTPGETRTGSVEEAQSVGVLADHDRDGIVIEDLQGPTGSGFGLCTQERGQS